MGYRYFETRYEDVVLGTGNAGDFDYAATVQYPFGYGPQLHHLRLFRLCPPGESHQLHLSVTVTNTGDTYTGKEAVGFYMQSPYTEYDKRNGVEKSSVQLVGLPRPACWPPARARP